MNGTSVSQTEAELAVERLLDKLQLWMMQQPEMLLLWTQDRTTRHRLAALIAKELTTIPVRDLNENTAPNRAMRRAMYQQLKRGNPEWWNDAASFVGGA